MDFTFDLDNATLKAGYYPVTVKNASLHVNDAKGSNTLKLDLQVNDGNFKGEFFTGWIWLDPTHRMSIKTVKEFLQAVTGSPVDGAVSLNTEEDNEGKIIFPDFIGEDLWVFAKPDGDYFKVTQYLSEGPSQDEQPW